MRIRTSMAFYLACMCNSVLLFGETKFTKISEIRHGSEADYIFLQDEDKKEWIYKQISNQSADDQIVIVLEKVAYDIAAPLQIPINRATVVSPTESFEHRLLKNYPGSLHLKVEGAPADRVLPWAGFDIHQKFRSPFLINRLGPLSAEEIGLRRVVIQTMAKNSDLAKIAALDTFLGNSDRSAANVFYDDKQKRFYGIDLGNCLMGNLPKCAQERISAFLLEKTPFTTEEKEGLRIYRQTLQDLTVQFPPAKTKEILDGALQVAGFVPSNSLLWNEDVERKIKKWKNLIEENHKSTLQLVIFLKENDL